MRTSALLAAGLLVLASGARAAPDGGVAVEADGGVAQPTLSPPTLLTDSPAHYPASMRESAQRAEVSLTLVIDAAGEVESARVEEHAAPAFDEAALHAAAGLRFHPALLGDQPVPVQLVYRYVFEPPAVAAPVATGVLKGKVRAKGLRRPIAGATLRFGTSQLTAETDAQGRFEIAIPPGKERIEVFAPGHLTGDFRETIVAGEAVEVVYALEPQVYNPYETIVRDDRIRTEVSRVTLQAQELTEVPGTMGDPFRVVMLLPGVSAMASGLGYPVVRGSMPAATGYYVDGIRVPALFHLFLGPAVIHPQFIDGLDFYPGSPPPQYGRLLGGAVEGRIARSRDKEIHGEIYADLINAGAFLEVPIEATGTSITAAGRVSYTAWMLALGVKVAIGDQPAPTPVLDLYDYQLRIEQKLAGGSLRLFAFGSSDVVGAKENDTFAGGALLSDIFHRVDLRYRRALGIGEGELGVTWGVDRIGVTGTSDGSGVGFTLDDRSLKARATWEATLRSDVRLRVGADVDHREAVTQISLSVPSPDPGPDPAHPQRIETTLDAPVAVGTFSGAYAELVFSSDPKWRVMPGVRVDNYHLVPGVDHFAFEPRLTVRYLLSDTVTLKGGIGWYHQPPVTLISLPAVDVGGLTLGLQEVVQSSVGVEWRPGRGIEVNVDAYYNPMFRTVELNPFSLPPNLGGTEDLGARLPSHGEAYGVEVLLRHPLGGRWFGWLSYSFQHSTRQQTFTDYDEYGTPVGARTADVAFTFEQRHVLNAVLSYQFSGNWTAGVVLHLNTGAPEAGGLFGATQVEGTDRSGTPQWIPVARDQVARLPFFWRIDARISKKWVNDTYVVEAYLDVLNASLRPEVLGFQYGVKFTETGPVLEKTQIGLPIFLPALGLKLSF